MEFSASSLPASPRKEMRTSPPMARRAPIWAATGSLPIGVTPPHSGVQPPLPPATTNARLNCFTPVCWAVVVRLKGGNRLVSTYGAKPAAPADGAPGEVVGVGDVVGAGELEEVGDGGGGGGGGGRGV